MWAPRRNVVNALKEKDGSLAFSSFRDPRFAMHSNHLMMQIILEALRAKALKEEYDSLGALRRKYLQYSIEGNAPVVAWKTMPSGFYISQNILIGDLKGALACVHVAIDPLKNKIIAHEPNRWWFLPNADLEKREAGIC